MLADHRVLVAEDEPFVAIDLEEAVREANGEAVGVGTVAEGARALENGDLHGAILDVYLSDVAVTPLAHVLFERGVAVVFHTASAIPPEIIGRYGKVAHCPKPMPSGWVVRHLAGLMGHSRAL